MSNVTEIHEHQWCYHGELLVEEVSRHRQEWCVGCGTVRVLFQMGWAYQYTDDFRAKLEAGAIIERDRYIGKLPDRIYYKKKGNIFPNRLGRGLKELLEEQTYPSPIKGLITSMNSKKES